MYIYTKKPTSATVLFSEVDSVGAYSLNPGKGGRQYGMWEIVYTRWIPSLYSLITIQSIHLPSDV